MLARRISLILGPLLILAACGGTGSADSTAPRTKNAALNVEFGSRWAGQSFAASAFSLAGLPVCSGVAAPANARAIGQDGKAYLGWNATMSGPPTEETADMVVLERRPPSKPEGPWTVVGYFRKSANLLSPEPVGKGSFLRVAFFRSTSTPCIGPRSNEVRWVPNVSA